MVGLAVDSSMIVIGILAASVLGNIALAILYGRAQKQAAERDIYKLRSEAQTKLVTELAEKLTAKERTLRALEKELAGRLSLDELVGKLNKLSPGGGGSGSSGA